MIFVEKINETYVKVLAEESIRQELTEYFSFFSDNYQWSPAYKRRKWDGKIRLYNYKTSQIYSGLVYAIIQFAKERNYEIEVENGIYRNKEVSLDRIEEFSSKLGLPERIKPNPHQLKALYWVIKRERQLLISPTASGKSLIIYMIARYLQGKKILIIVPRISLVEQLFGDFVNDYGYTKSNNINRIHSGADKNMGNREIAISTYQSLLDMPKKWFEQFDAVIGDEAHMYDAKSVSKIIEKCINARYRIGTTGSLKDIVSSRLTLEGLFGPVKMIASTMELVQKKIISDFEIHIVILNYSRQDRENIKGMDHSQEKEYIMNHPKRLSYIENLMNSMDGNSIYLSDLVEKHVKPFYQKMSQRNNRKTYLAIGEVELDEREDIRHETEKMDGIDIIANPQVFSTGVNIKRIKNLILGYAGKSKVRLIQSIGRAIRKTSHYPMSYVFDISDDLSTSDGNNISLRQLKERIRIYSSEGFKYKIHYVRL